MKENIKIAWRNIWRNKRRTLITSASIFFAVFFALIMRSFQLGSYDTMIFGIIESYSGFIQVQGKEYLDEPIMDNCMPYNQDIEKKIISTENVNLVIPRIQSFGMASSGEKTKNALVIGIDPEKEIQVNNLENRIVKIRFTTEKLKSAENENKFPADFLTKLKTIENNSYSSTEGILFDLKLPEEEQIQYFPIIEEYFKFSGEYLTENDNGVLIADRLSKYLEINVGDSVIVLSQGFHGVSAAGIYPVKGILKLSSPDFDNTMIYMTLQNAQQLYSAYEVSDDLQDTSYLVSYLALGVDNKKNNALIAAVDVLNTKLDTEIYKAISWKDFNRELVQQIQGDSISGIAMLGLLYLIIGFGVLGTVLMMTAERKREFGVMIAVGMQKAKLKLIVTIEMIILGLLGIVSGILASSPIILFGYYFPIQLKGDMAKMMEEYNLEPIMPMAWFDTYFINQTIVVLIIVILASTYPIFRIGKLKVINALKG
jgi:ABC-type lipoprotein release transport system permease subunit